MKPATRRKIKKSIFCLLIVVVVALCLHFILQCFITINYPGTFSTKYVKKETTQIIITRQFEIETPLKWIHIFSGYGEEGEAFGFFWIRYNEIVNYEYGIFANTFSSGSIDVLTTDSVMAGRFLVYIAKMKDERVGIYVPRQHEMEMPLSFSIPKANDQVVSALLYGIEKMSFKRVYFFWPELEEAISYFKTRWSEEEIESFKNKPEEDAVTDLHFSVGMWIRNNWLRNPKDSSLLKFFNSNGVYHFDDMSSIVLTSLHRDLNGKYIDLVSQAYFYQQYWMPVFECKEKEKRAALLCFDRLQCGSRVQICFPVVTSENSRNAIQYACPDTDWIFDPKKDLVVEGLLVDKFYRNSPENVFVKVKLTGMSDKNTLIFSNKVKIGDEVDLSLRGLWIVQIGEKER